MAKIAVWSCKDCGNEDTYSVGDDVTLDKLKADSENSMECKECGASSIPIEVIDFDDE